MKRLLQTLLASTLILGTAPAFAAPQTPSQAPFQVAFFNAPKPEVSMDYTHFTLKNGLNVYLSRNPLKPRFYAQVVVNTGGKYDPQDATGIAHYLEHMLFKGTDELATTDFAKEKPIEDEIVAKYETLFNTKDAKEREKLTQEINKLSIETSKYAIPGELDSLYTKLGAKGLNAYTSNEETVYLVSLPKNRIEQWAKVESERFKDPVFRLFQSELEAVFEEKNRSMDNKESVLWNAVSKQLYKKHPYGVPVLGWVDHIKNPSLKKMYDFYHTYYVPNNMALVISGDIDVAKTRQIIEKYFNSWEAKPVPPFKVPQEPPIQGVERVTAHYKGEEKVLLAFRTAPYHDKDKLALTMIDMLLDSGSAGLIKLDLVQPQKVRTAGSYPEINNDYGAEYLYAVPKEGQSLEEAEKLLLQEVEKIKKGQFDESIMKAIALDAEISQKRALEDNQGRVSLMQEAFLKHEKIEDLLDRSHKMRELSKADIVRVANKYFQSNYVAGYRKDGEYSFPKIQKPELEKVQLNPNQTSAFAASVEALNPPPVQPEWVDIRKELQAKSYAPGVLYYYSRNPVDDLFSFSIDYDYGEKHKPEFCTVMSELNEAGTGDMSASDVANELFKLGVKAHFSCGQYGFSMQLSGSDEKFEPALALGEKLLWNAKLDPDRFKARIQNVLTGRQDQKNDLQTLRRALRNWVRYGQDSEFIDRPSAAELKQASVDQYPAMRDALKQQNFKIHYIGQLPMDKVEKLVHKYHQPAEIPVPLLNPRQQPPIDVLQRHEDPVHIYFLNHPSAQSNIDLIIPESETDPSENVLSSFYNQYMDGGMGAVMFQEVRESRSLAYSTWSYFFQGGRLGDQDQMLAYIGTQADKTLDSVKLLIDLMRKPPRSESHFNRAHQALDNQYRTSRVDFRELFSTVDSWAELGFDHDPRPVDFKKVDQVTLDQLFDFIQQKIASKPLTLTIVGDRDKINLEALRKIATVTEVSKDQLFRD